MPRFVFRMHDVDPSGHGGAIPVPLSEASKWNDRGWGVFQTVNAFKSDVRRIDNLERIEAWAIDMDDGTKKEQAAKLGRFALVPSSVVETKRGYQAYWRAKDGRSAHWNAIMIERMVPHFGADKNARDMARILRVPGFRHLKDPADPFMIREVHRWDVSYSEFEMVRALPPPPASIAKAKHEAIKRELHADGSDFWDRVWSMDCAEGLRRLSGSGAVRGEVFTFHANRTGTMNILVDGKGTSCWIDAEGRIGSMSDGGPSLFFWLKWYGHSGRECVRILKDAFPELEKKQ